LEDCGSVGGGRGGSMLRCVTIDILYR
jgi:hypothetical protein